MAGCMVTKAGGCDFFGGGRRKTEQEGQNERQFNPKDHPASATQAPPSNSFRAFKLAPQTGDRVFEILVGGFPIQSIAESPSQDRHRSSSCALGE